MGFGEAAIRVIPYFQDWQIGAVILALVLLLIITIMIGRTRSALIEQSLSQQAAISALLELMKERLPNIAPRVVEIESPRRDPAAPTTSTDPTKIYPDYEEFGPMTETEHNIARIYGREVLRDNRARARHT